jgi:hypothetical protein
VREVKSEEGKLEGGEVRASRCHLYMVRNVDAWVNGLSNKRERTRDEKWQLLFEKLRMIPPYLEVPFGKWLHLNAFEFLLLVVLSSKDGVLPLCPFKHLFYPDSKWWGREKESNSPTVYPKPALNFVLSLNIGLQTQCLPEKPKERDNASRSIFLD